MQRPSEGNLPEIWPVDVEKFFQSLVRKHALQFELVAQDMRQAIVDGKFPSLTELYVGPGDFTTDSCRIHFASTKRSRNVKNPSRSSAKRILEDNTTKIHPSLQTVPISPSKPDIIAATSSIRSSLLSLSTNNDDFNILRDTSLNTIMNEVHASLPNNIEAAVRVHADSAMTLASRAYMDGNLGEYEVVSLTNPCRSAMAVRGHNAGNNGVASPNGTSNAPEDLCAPEFEEPGRGPSCFQSDVAGATAPERLCANVSPPTNMVTTAPISKTCIDGDGEMVQHDIASPTGNSRHTVNHHSIEGFDPTTMDITTYTSAVLQHILREEDKYDELWRHVQYSVDDQGEFVVDMSNQHLVRRKYDDSSDDDGGGNAYDDDGDGSDNGHRSEKNAKNKGDATHNQDTESKDVEKTSASLLRHGGNNDTLPDNNVDVPVDNYHARYITSSRSLATARALVDYLDTRTEDEEDEDTRAARELDRLLDMEMEYFH